MKTKILILSIAASLPATWALSQDAERPPRDGDRPRGERPRDGERPRGDGPRDGQQPRGERPAGAMPIPFLHALDADEDGIISADEIKGAPAALKKLDRNNDGKLTREEWQPRPPQRQAQGEGEREDGERKAGPRDGERPRGEGPRDGERPRPEGARDGERPRGEQPRDGARPRDGEAREKPAGDEAKAGRERPAGDGQAQRERPQGPPPPLLEALDTDRDGTISEDEIGKSPESLAKLDKNHDGQLGPREYGLRPPQGPPPREGGRDGDKPDAKPEQ